jgi:hypothetical protein
VHEQPHEPGGDGQGEELGGHGAERALADEQEGPGKVGVAHDAAGQPFGQAAKQGERPESDDEGWDLEPPDQHRVQPSPRGADRHGQERGPPHGQAEVPKRRAHHDRCEAQKRAHRQVDPAGEDHRSQGQGEEADLHTRSRHLGGVGHAQEVRAEGAEERHLAEQQDGQHALVGEERAAHGLSHERPRDGVRRRRPRPRAG